VGGRHLVIYGPNVRRLVDLVDHLVCALYMHLTLTVAGHSPSTLLETPKNSKLAKNTL
jgi:hypothetical protein